MSCLNCRKDTIGTAVFCNECLKEMEAYPVEKGTPAIIPAQPSPPAQKKQGRELFGSLEENLYVSRRTARRLAGALFFTTLLLLFSIAALIYVYIYGIPDFMRNIQIPW